MRALDRVQADVCRRNQVKRPIGSSLRAQKIVGSALPKTYCAVDVFKLGLRPGHVAYPQPCSGSGRTVHRVHVTRRNTEDFNPIWFGNRTHRHCVTVYALAWGQPSVIIKAQSKLRSVHRQRHTQCLYGSCYRTRSDLKIFCIPTSYV